MPGRDNSKTVRISERHYTLLEREAGAEYRSLPMQLMKILDDHFSNAETVDVLDESRPCASLPSSEIRDSKPLSPAELAKALGCSRPTVDVAIHNGTLPAARIGRRLFIPHRVAVEILENGRIPELQEVGDD